MAQLIVPEMAVYRPWAWIELIPNNPQLTINHPYGVDQKFRWLKDFKYSVMMGGQGSMMEFTIFDNQGEWNQTWLQVVSKTLEAQKNGGEFYVRYQWGWAGRMLSEQQSNISHTGQGIPPPPFCSLVGRAIITGATMEYVEGGINYRFTGADPMSLTQASSLHEEFKDVSFRVAVDMLMKVAKERKIVPENYAVTYDPELEKVYDLDQPGKTWQCGGFTLLLALASWLSMITPRQNKPPRVGPVMYPIPIEGREGIKFSLSVHATVNNSANTSSSTNGFVFGENDILHVNPPDVTSNYGLGIGKHVVLSMRPNFAGNQFWVTAVDINAAGKMDRSMHNSRSNDAPGRTQMGTSTNMVTQSLDSPMTPRQTIDALKGYIDGAAASHGSQFFPSDIQVDILGCPQVNALDITKYVKLHVWNPAFVDNKDNWQELKWVRRPPRDERYLELNMLSGYTHTISDGSYVTTLSLKPVGEGLDKILS